ncbi:glycosyltransferase family 25 protein [Aurantimonas sp. C2-6-R+9]|uniref:glycosyltransferase family 25 protein n=1 Tax=unclassified Aurantimonas TaxID=2638230 RepID=UPI002E1793F5|nr:glycosyltransferase family 25 protein [Aurantimonas sp. C2-6-R+9]
MKINYYVINLDRSPDRRAAISADAAAVGIDLIRVKAVDGKTVAPEARDNLDVRGFRRLHGKIPMDGEYGCYQSHIDVFDIFLASDADIAVIFKDDAQLTPALPPALEEILALDDWDVVMLMHHRLPVFRGHRSIGDGRLLGVALFGPTGSSAAYVVNRRGAKALRRGLVPMRLPYDVALERGWALGVRVRHVKPDLVAGNPQTRGSLIGGRKKYATMKLAPWRRLSTLLFRAGELVRRAHSGLTARADQ